MQSTRHVTGCATETRRALAQLASLPLRPTTARLLVLDWPEPELQEAEGRVANSIGDLDPGWAAALTVEPPLAPLAIVADHAWWAASAEAADRLWRHSVAVALAARRLAREGGDPDPDLVGKAGLLGSLGYWAIAAVDPACLTRLFAVEDPGSRRREERRVCGVDSASLGRELANRWELDPLIVDAAWLAGDSERGLNEASEEPERLAWIQAGFALAERTPWAFFPTHPFGQGATADPRVRVLIAEVQVRCGSSPFVAADIAPGEEPIIRRQARLLAENERLRAGIATRDRLLAAMAAAQPGESPRDWAADAGLIWCAEPGVTTARVIWTTGGPVSEASAPAPDVVIPLGGTGRRRAEVHLWGEADALTIPDAALGGWCAWSALIADRADLADRLETVGEAIRSRIETEEPSRRKARLDALGEFAAGAGHELNNPLAVILGRAQLLLATSRDADTTRSLKAIITQAQRSHRILRDLMYIARPPEFRPRPCQPDDIVKASLREARDEAETRGIRLFAELRDPAPRAWVDPDPIRHLTDVFVRNALEATPAGGTIRVVTGGDEHGFSLTVRDDGRGMTASEQAHLFDPFFCGRQAGRGLGLGLPRAAKILERANGELRWHSSPGQGTTFQIRLPLEPFPPPVPIAIA